MSLTGPGSPKGQMMRQEFLAVETIEQAEQLAPWAAKIVECDGGYMAFESITDYETWMAQV